MARSNFDLYVHLFLDVVWLSFIFVKLYRVKDLHFNRNDNLCACGFDELQFFSSAFAELRFFIEFKVFPWSTVVITPILFFGFWQNIDFHLINIVRAIKTTILTRKPAELCKLPSR